jgi:hypothetical protein
MKKKLLQEQREKAIIDSFAKTFNKIKRLDENYIDEVGAIKEHKYKIADWVKSKLSDSDIKDNEVLILKYVIPSKKRNDSFTMDELKNYADAFLGNTISLWHGKTGDVDGVIKYLFDNKVLVDTYDAPSSININELIQLFPVDEEIDGVKIIEITNREEMFGPDGIIVKNYPEIMDIEEIKAVKDPYFIPIKIQNLVLKMLEPIAIHYGYGFHGKYVNYNDVAKYAKERNKPYAFSEYMS